MGEHYGEYTDAMKMFLHTNYGGELDRVRDMQASVYLALDAIQTPHLVGKDGVNIQKLAKAFSCELRISPAAGPDGENILQIKGLLGDVQELYRFLITSFSILKEKTV